MSNSLSNLRSRMARAIKEGDTTVMYAIEVLRKHPEALQAAFKHFKVISRVGLRYVGEDLAESHVAIYEWLCDYMDKPTRRYKDE